MSTKSKLQGIFEGTDTKFGHTLDWVILALIVYSIITFTIETLPGLDEGALQFLWVSEIIVVLIFTVEYVLRVYTANQKGDYIFGFWGIIDIVAILPFYIMLVLGLGGIDLRAARAFRLLRIFRLLKLGRYSRAIERFHRAFRIAREEMVMYLFLAIILLFVSATGIYYFENPAQPEAFKSILHSLWWAIATLTTVGYGDVYPITFGGRLFTFLVLMVGLGIVAVPAGLVASALSQARRDELGESQSN
jgi:voltage-gated potassium channel